MAKGTPSQGRRNKKASHIRCRRCGNRSYHRKTGICSSCGYGYSPRIRSFSWQKKD
ncbi:MAG TPA: 50S ribosomal protein L37e [Candidatus Woesearchaeota archaeon]|nr:50S ribosomal protein L37e [Candidatus Woesearchaeota archaeon]